MKVEIKIKTQITKEKYENKTPNSKTKITLNIKNFSSAFYTYVITTN